MKKLRNITQITDEGRREIKQLALSSIYNDDLLEYAKQLPSKVIDKGDSLILHSSDIQNTLYQIMEITQRENIALEDIHIKKPSLQEVFEKIIQEKNAFE